VPGGSRIPRSDTVEDRHPRAHQREEAQRIHAKHSVEVIADDKRVTLLSRRFQAEAGPSGAETGEIQPVHGKARRWFRPERPRLRPASQDNYTMPVSDYELHRLLSGWDQGGLHRSAGQVTELIDPNRRAIGHNLIEGPIGPRHNVINAAYAFRQASATAM
jgi:hypothetical protein